MATSAKWKVALIGECMIELQATPSGDITQTFGGDTFNTAAYLARIGAAHNVQVDYVSAVGDDRFSRQMLDFWKAEGVGVSLTRRLAGRHPGLYYIHVQPDGERVFSYWRGEAAAKDCFSASGAELVREKLGNFHAVYLSGISLGILREDGRERLLCRLQELRAQGLQIYFDCNYRPRVWGATPKEALAAARYWYMAMLRLCHVVFLTTEEAPAVGCSAKLAGEKLAAGISALGPDEVLIKNGSEACLVSHKGQLVSVPARRLAQVVDTTAAGDSFAAAYLMGRHLGRSVEDQLLRRTRLPRPWFRTGGRLYPASPCRNCFREALIK